MEGDVNKKHTALEPESKKECTINDCVVGVVQNKLQCSTSKEKVHLRCTVLPPYQLQRYLTSEKSSCTFICTNYLKVPECPQNISKREPNEVFQEKYEKKLEMSCDFNKEIATLKKTIRNKENELDTVTTHWKKNGTKKSSN